MVLEPSVLGEGSYCLQVGTACEQRVWKVQPEGGDRRLGISPIISCSARCASSSGSASGTAASKAFV